ncbi:MAG: FHA domain-containing protein [Candidatus Krumholzibacteria bacterium]|nr:FHA domain-containing protein [Candidatus Krumholzibacteria bacterium]MDH4338437.1 FHA domain-containing protein [Candidatus Krumholzibacteria bacterium]MDH5271078.1 FHA domain-containing protein [Candidatus Krumholzibacteria bacterium]MDH5627135.1 FHA domain-containing protein [Candidatus Krumholzibacteria bacterium]
MSQTPKQDSPNLDERLNEYRELLSQFEAVRDRLRRAEEERGSVPRRVYDKVRAEYDHQLDALRGQMTPLRAELDSFRNRYEALLRDENGALEAIEEELAEVTFRHKIGEFSDEQAASVRGEVEARLETARARIGGVRDTLAAMEDAAPVASAAEATETQAAVVEAAPAPEIEEPAPAPEAPRAAAPAPAPRPAPEPAPVHQPAPEPEPAPAPEAAAEVPAAPEPAPAPPAPAVEAAPATPAAAAPVDEAASRRPVLRQSAAGEKTRAGFENPHDWIDEFGRDQKRQSDAGARQAQPAAGSPPAPGVPAAPPSLVFVSGPHAGQSIPLLQTTLTIGREHDNNIEIKDADVARYHARILNDRGEYVVEDMASTTGTWVNGVRAERAALGHGDVIRIGQTEIAVDFEWASNSLERAGIDPTT